MTGGGAGFQTAAPGEACGTSPAAVLATIRAHLEARDVPPAEVQPERSFTADLDLSSLDLQTLAQTLEDEFEIDIPEVDGAEITTVGDAIRLVLRLVGSGEAKG